MSEMQTADSWVGRNVIVWPEDDTSRECEVIGVDSVGWEFEVLAVVNRRGERHQIGSREGWRVGDRLFVSHSKPLSMVEATEVAR